MADHCSTNDGHVGHPCAGSVEADSRRHDQDDLVVTAGKRDTRIEVSTLPRLVVVSEKEMSERLRAWFDTHKAQWAGVEADALKDGGPWWLVPSWTQPLSEAAGHQVSPKEALIAAALGQVLTAQPELVLNRQNVDYRLPRRR